MFWPTSHVMLGGATGTILVREELLTPADRERAVTLLERFGCGGRERQRFASLSEGERRRVYASALTVVAGCVQSPRRPA
jgi:ABC-type molybdenum transport system ATPase subunit/photorepair protein PhrA